MNKQFVLFATSIFLLGIVYFIPARTITSNNLTASIIQPIQKIDVPKNVEAKSVYVERLSDGMVLMEKNSDEIRPLASITKIASIMTFLRFASSTEKVKILPNALETEGSSSLRANELLLAKNLINMALTESSNDAIVALVEHIIEKNKFVNYEQGLAWFVREMNKTVQEIGAQSTRFINPTGLDIATSTETGGYGSAKDLMLITRPAISSGLWNYDTTEDFISLSDIRHVIKPTFLLRNKISQFIGAKTGFTDLAGGNLLIVFEHPIGSPVGIVILGSSYEGRFKDADILLDVIHKNIVQ